MTCARGGLTPANRAWALLLALSAALAACSAEDSFVGGSYAAVDAPGGGVEVEFRADGAYAISDSGTVLDQGTFTVDGGSLSFESSTECARAGHKQATYWWILEDDALDLRPMSGDGCTVREDAASLGLLERLGGPTTAP